MGRKSFLIILFFIIPIAGIFSNGKMESVPSALPNIAHQTVTEPAATEPARNEPVRTEPTRGELVTKALAEAYPKQIDRVEFRNDDWALLLRGTWYYYAGGRFLPENLLENASGYTPLSFYNYREELPPWRTPNEEEAERFRAMTANRNQNPSKRSPHFLDDLWRAHSHSESYDRVKSIRFLGKPVLVHYLILENLSLVEEHILTAAKTDPQVQAWINNISTLEGWNWRNVAETQSRSYHAYGLAVDILPRSYQGKQTYWLWTTRYRQDWWNVSYNERYHPPAAVIKAFEKYGFIWGGKWAYYDTMHFEYRPEVLILSGMPPETRR